MANDTYVLNEGRVVGRTTASGKTRFHMRIVSEPLYIHTNAKALGKPVAEIMAHYLRERVKGIGATVSDATKRFREEAAKAFRENKRWAQQRYAGGKIGAMGPKPSDRQFNDSGRFAQSIVVGAAKDDSWRVNVAANRLGGGGNSTQARVIWERLIALVPEFGDMRELMAASPIVRARIRMQELMIQKGKATDKPATAMDVAKAVARVINSAGRMVA